ncbi:MAG: F0F1 ATP synthase subunit B [Dongiaceae bacterium]
MELLGNPEFWVLVAFVVFIVLAAKPIGRALNKSLDQRSAKIKAELDEAQSLRDEAQRLLSENQRRQREALKEAADIVAQAQGEAERLKRDAAAAFEATMARREKVAMEKIAQAEAQAVAEVRAQAVDLAMAATTRVLTQAMDERRSAALIDEAIADLERKLH